MFVRKSLAGAVTLAVTGSVLTLTAGAAHAVDPNDTTFTPTLTDVIGVGSDTTQNTLFRLATSYNATLPAGAPRLATFAATGGGTIPLPSGAVNRPNGSTAGKNVLYGAANNTDVDFARSSSALSTNDVNAGLQAFPFALDTLKMVVSNSVPSNAPVALTPAQIVSIYKGDITNWSQVGGQSGVIAPKTPQPGSGTRAFWDSQLRSLNGGVAVVYGASVVEVQEHDDSSIKNDPNAIAPFSEGRGRLLGTTLRFEEGYSADRAVYNVIRTADLGNQTLQGIFGTSGYFCSDDAIDEIVASGFLQLDSVADGGVCGQATQGVTSNFQTNEPVVPVPTTTTVTGVSPSPGALRLTARVAGNPTPTGTVQFIDSATDQSLGTANLIGGTATLNLTGRAPGSYGVAASYTPTTDSPFVASNDTGSVVVKARSAISESFPASVKKSATSARGVVTVVFAGTSTKPSGRVTVKEGAKTVGSGVLRSGKATITLLERKVGKGKSTLKISYPGNARGFGSSKSFSIIFKK